MLHTKFQDHRLFCTNEEDTNEEDIFRFSPYMGMAAILVM